MITMKKRITSLFIIALIVTAKGLCSAQVDNYLAKLLKSHVIPGFSVAVVRNDSIIFLKGYGVEYRGGSSPMTAETSTAVGSVAKSFTALAMMQLEERGKINLDDKVVKYIPWFRTANKEVSDRITIRMLLDNTSGLEAPVIRDRDAGNKAAENLVHSMESVYLTSDPGSHYEYSNDGFALAGLIISKVTGMTYNEYLDRYIFKPLEMNMTTNNPDDFSRLHVLFGHYPGIDRGIPVYREDPWLAEYVAAGSILRSSARDMGHYLVALLNGGAFRDKQVISRKSLEEMWRSYSSFPGISKDDGGEDLPLHYGLGWFSGDLDGEHYIFHGGNRRSMSSMVALVPDKKIGVVFLANIDLTFIDRYKYPDLVNIANNIIRLCLNKPVSQFAIPVIKDPTINNFTLPVNEEEKYTGKYIMTKGTDWAYTGSTLNITMNEKELTGEVDKGDQILDRFIIDFVTKKTAVTRNIDMTAKITFNLSGSGKVRSVIVGSRKYSKLSEGIYSTFHPEASGDSILKFYYPDNWNIAWSGDDFKGFDKDNHNLQITGEKTKNSSSWKSRLKALFPGNQIIHEGMHNSEPFGDNLWNEVAVVSSDGKNYFQHYLVTKSAGHEDYTIILTSPYPTSTSVTSIIPAILGTFEWRSYNPN